MPGLRCVTKQEFEGARSTRNNNYLRKIIMRKMKKAKLAITPAKLIQCHKAEDKQKRAFVVRANADPYF